MSNFIDFFKSKSEKPNDKKSNTINKIISVVAAIIFWTYVIGEVNPETTTPFQNITVQLMNVNSINQSGLVLIGDNNYKVKVVVQGKRGDVMKITSDDIVAKVDLKGYSKGINEIPVEVTAPESVIVTEVSPARIKVQLDQVVSKAKPVKMNISNSLPEGYEPGIPVLSLPQVLVDGPESLVDSVASLNVDVDVKNMATPFSGNMPITPVDIKGNKIFQVTPQSSFVYVTIPILKVKELPLSVDIRGKPSNGYIVSGTNIPETVKIKGPNAIIDKMTKVTAKPIDLSNVTATSKIPIKCQLPPGVILADENTGVFADVTVEKISSKILTYDKGEISIAGLKSSLTADMSNVPAINATVSARQNDIGDIGKEDITLSIDLSNSDPGENRVKIAWSSDKKVNGVVLNPQEIDVIIQKK